MSFLYWVLSPQMSAQLIPSFHVGRHSNVTSSGRLLGPIFKTEMPGPILSTPYLPSLLQFLFVTYHWQCPPVNQLSLSKKKKKEKKSPDLYHLHFHCINTHSPQPIYFKLSSWCLGKRRREKFAHSALLSRWPAPPLSFSLPHCASFTYFFLLRSMEQKFWSVLFTAGSSMSKTLPSHSRHSINIWWTSGVGRSVLCLGPLAVLSSIFPWSGGSGGEERFTLWSYD